MFQRINTEAAGWKSHLVGRSARSVAEIADDDIGPRVARMRRTKTSAKRLEDVRVRTARKQTVAMFLVIAVMFAGAAGSASVGATAAAARCGLLPVAPPPSHEGILTVAVDRSISTDSKVVRARYASAALAVVERAAEEHAFVRVVMFDASGVGARVVFEGSFADVSADELFNLAAANRTRCVAREAITRAFRMTSGITGSDVAGVARSEILAAKSTVGPAWKAAVTILTDGCQAPAARGLNRRLTDLCLLLARGVKPAVILRAHEEEFSIGDARNVSVAVLGIGVGRDLSGSSSILAARLVAFWTLVVCKRAHPASCSVRSVV